jgi:hypothetical protein
VKTAFSPRENAVFLHGKRCYLAQDSFFIASEFLTNCCHSPTICHHPFSPLYKGFLRRWWQSGSKKQKKFFLMWSVC